MNIGDIISVIWPLCGRQGSVIPWTVNRDRYSTVFLRRLASEAHLQQQALKFLATCKGNILRPTVDVLGTPLNLLRTPKSQPET